MIRDSGHHMEERDWHRSFRGELSKKSNEDDDEEDNNDGDDEYNDE